MTFTSKEVVIKKFFQKLFKKKKDRPYALIIPRTSHSLSRQQISSNALKVLYRLHEKGFSSYLVGGCVRDLLLGLTPKDFDVATNARPEDIKKHFRNCLLIGRRFRLAHIRFGREVIEVTTFRATDQKKFFKFREKKDHGMLRRENVYGCLEEDVFRRDFTVNSLYYNIADFSIVDYCNAFADLENKLIRIIGSPVDRYQEDPVRLLRAIRFSVKLSFSIEIHTAAPIREMAPLLQHIPAARLYEEVLKLFQGGYAYETYLLLKEYHLLPQLFPALHTFAENSQETRLIQKACQNTDKRLQENKTVSPAFLFASFLWTANQAQMQALIKDGMPIAVVAQKASIKILTEQQKRTAIPKRYTHAIREIWDLQHKLIERKPHQTFYLLNHPRFRAALDLLSLRESVNEFPENLSAWWTSLSESDDITRQAMISALPEPPKHKKRYRKSSHL